MSQAERKTTDTTHTESQIESKWEIKTQDGQELGAHDVSTIVRLIKEGKLKENDFVRCGNTEWQSLKDSPLMGEFDVKVFFDPVRAHAEFGLGIGAILFGLLSVVAFTFAYLTSEEQAQGVLRAAIFSVGMFLAFSAMLRNIGWSSLGLYLFGCNPIGCLLSFLGPRAWVVLALWGVILSFVYQAPGKDWAYRLGTTIGIMLVAVLIGIAGVLLGMVLGYVVGAIVGFFRKSKYRVAV